MVIRQGRKGKFIGCSNYPKCRNTKPMKYLEDVEKRDISKLELQLKNPPSKPQLGEYGLTTSLVNSIENEIERLSIKHKQVIKVLGLLAWLLMYSSALYLIRDSLHDLYTRGDIITALSFMFLLTFPVSILFGIISASFEKLIDRFFTTSISSINGYHDLEKYKINLDSFEKDFIEYKSYEQKHEEYMRVREAKKEQFLSRKRAEFWRNLDGHAFETEIAGVLRILGYKVEQTKGSGDWGVDLFLNDDIVVQCKATNSPVSPSVVRDLFGTMNHYDAKKGIIISTGGFTPGSYEFQEGKNIELWDMDKLLDLTQNLDIEER